MKKTLHAWWSEKMAKVVPSTAIYATPDGREVETCYVTDSPNQCSDWPDIKYLGEVTQWIRTGRVNRLGYLVHPTTGDE